MTDALTKLLGKDRCALIQGSKNLGFAIVEPLKIIAGPDHWERKVLGPPVRMTWAQYRRRQCTFLGRTVKLGRVEAEIISTLVMNRAPILIDDLIEACYPDPDSEPEYARDILVHLIGRLRQKMPGVILTNWGRGYSLLDCSPLAKAA